MERVIDVRKGLSCLAHVRETIIAYAVALSGTPCVRGTRIPAHDVARMLANGDGIDEIRDAWPVVSEEQIDAAAL